MSHDTPDDVFVDDITFQASDRFTLAATLFLPRGRKTHAVLINSATAVPRKVYRGFASYLAGRGCICLTYDYRGIGGSRPASLKGFNATMSDWAAKDVAAAAQWIGSRYKDLPQLYVGHSFGGQALGLIPDNGGISRALLIAAQAGYWGLMTPPENYRVWAYLNLIGRPATHLLGYAPGKLGLGEDLPKGVLLEWARWVMSPRYFFDDPALEAARANFAGYRGALRALCFSDDPWATRKAVELLCSGFTLTWADIRTIEPKDVSAQKIGHFGFFRPEHRETLWKDAGDSLLQVR